MQHTVDTNTGPVTVEATEPAPGLRVFQLPADVSLTSQHDWTRNAMTTANEISFGGHAERLMELLRDAGGEHPNA